MSSRSAEQGWGRALEVVSEEADDMECIQDLLRQDETAERGSACVE